MLDGMWKDHFLDTPDGEPVILDTIGWLGRATLDMWVFVPYTVPFEIIYTSSVSGKVRTQYGCMIHADGDFVLAAFEYEFGSLDQLDNPISNTYLNLVYLFPLPYFSLT